MKWKLGLYSGLEGVGLHKEEPPVQWGSQHIMKGSIGARCSSKSHLVLPDNLKSSARSAKTLGWDFVNPAVAMTYGVFPT